MKRLSILAPLGLISLVIGCDDAGSSSSCGNVVLEDDLPVRPSSFRPCPNGDSAESICDPAEACDFTYFDLFCFEGNCEVPPQDGDLRCHRVCRDGECAPGEICVERPVYVSDTPTRFVPMCLCDGDECAERDGGAEGGLEAWVALPDMPVDLFYHAAASDDDWVYVSGGLSRFEESGTLFNRDERGVHAMRISAQGDVGPWFTAGQLPASLTDHASVVAADRLYILGGEEGRDLTDSVHSAPILEDGTLGPWRAETPFPTPRSEHVSLVHGQQIIVVGGRFDRLSSGIENTEGWIAAMGEDGVLESWRSFAVPENPYYNEATIAAGRLYIVSDTRENYPDVAAEVYSSEIPDPGAEWDFRPEAGPEGENRAFSLDALRSVRLVGACGILVSVLPGAKAMTAPLSSNGELGTWRVASGVPDGPSTGYAVTASPSGVLFVFGGPGISAVWSSRPGGATARLRAGD